MAAFSIFFSMLSAAFQHAFSIFQLAFSSLQKLKGLKTRDPGRFSAMLTEAEKLKDAGPGAFFSSLQKLKSLKTRDPGRFSAAYRS